MKSIEEMTTSLNLKSIYLPSKEDQERIQETRDRLVEEAKQKYPNRRISRIFETCRELHPAQRPTPNETWNVLFKVKVY